MSTDYWDSEKEFLSKDEMLKKVFEAPNFLAPTPGTTFTEREMKECFEAARKRFVDDTNCYPTFEDYLKVIRPEEERISDGPYNIDPTKTFESSVQKMLGKHLIHPPRGNDQL